MRRPLTARGRGAAHHLSPWWTSSATRSTPSPPITPAVLAWNDATVLRIAQDIYEERRLPEGTLDNVRLGMLADALLDAGCEDEELIQHCRQPGPHVRGCWAVDLCLRKS